MTTAFSRCGLEAAASAPAPSKGEHIPDFRTIYRRYAGKVYRKCVGMLKEENLAKDATQDVFIKVFQNLPGFRREARVSSWIYRIAHNCCIDRLRRRKKRLATDELPGDPPEPQERPYYQVLERNLRQLDRVLAALPDDYRMVLMKKYRDELSIKEIAAELRLSESAVKMKIKRAREKARSYRREMFSGSF